MSDDLVDLLGTEETSCLEFKQSTKAGNTILQAIHPSMIVDRAVFQGKPIVHIPFDARLVPGTSRDDLDLQRFRSDIIPAFASTEVIDEDERPIELQLASLGITDTGQVPTALGHLLIGINPTAAVPGAYLQFVRHDGRGVGDAVVDAQEIRGNVLDSAGWLQSVLLGHLHTSLESAGGFVERDQPEYPIEALREACMNAVVHRNYESSYAPIRISWFSDRIEITNPGGPFGQVRADNFDRVNDYRNPSLAGAMKSLGYVNRFGRGIGRIRKSLQVNGNPPAEFAIDDSSWIIVIRRAG